VADDKTFGANSFKSIRIKNPGHGDVFVLGGRAYSAGIYGVAKKDTSDAILQATVPRIYGVADLHVLLQRDAEHDLPIFNLPKKVDSEEKDLPSRRVCFLIFWRTTSSSWLRSSQSGS
jgi:hypothetical protein